MKPFAERIKPSRIILPVLIGIAVVVYLFYDEFKSQTFLSFHLNWSVAGYILLAILMMVIRDLGYMWRIRILSLHKFSWRNAFNINFLWEFTSAITPSAVGGTSLAIIYVYKEGLKLGRSTALVLATAFLDELYFIVMFPLLVFTVGYSSLFSLSHLADGDVFNRYFYFATIGYTVKFIFVGLIAYGLFISPKAIHRLLQQIFRIRFLRRWQNKADDTGKNIVESSAVLKQQGFLFWLKSFFASFLSWTARYLVVNFLLLALLSSLNSEAYVSALSFSEQLLLFARQLVMWIMLLVMPSPGGSGFAELIFSDYLSNIIPLGYVGLMALLWRMITYYPYLIIGAFLVPKWGMKHFGKKENIGL